MDANELLKDRLDKFIREIEELCGIAQRDKTWLDNRQVCELLKISIRTLQYYRDYEIIPFSMIGRKCYYKISDVEQLLKKDGNR